MMGYRDDGIVLVSPAVEVLSIRNRENDMISATMVGVGLQMPRSWHDGGLFIGMHWLWWLFWIVTIVVLLWAVWRSVSEDRSIHRRSLERESAEEALRERFAQGEIDEEQLKHRIEVLRESRGR